MRTTAQRRRLWITSKLIKKANTKQDLQSSKRIWGFGIGFSISMSSFGKSCALAILRWRQFICHRVKKKKKKQKKTAFVSMKGSCWISSEMFHWVLKTICRYFSKTFDSLVRGASYPRVFSVDASCLFGITSTKITSYFQNVLGSFVCSMLMVAAVTLELKSELKECLYSAFIGKPVM